MNSKKNNRDLIDLKKIVFSFWEQKWAILIITIVILTFGVYKKMNSKIPKSIYTATTEIITNSTFDEFKYSAYNAYIERGNPNINLSDVFASYNSENEKALDALTTYEISKFQIGNNYLKKIDKYLLFDLFIEKINENDLFIKAVKELKLIKKENYQNKIDYENAVKKLASSIILTNNPGQTKIVSKTNNKTEWEKLLYYIKDNINLEVKNFILRDFASYIENTRREIQYTIDDIDFELENHKDDDLYDQYYVNRLIKLKKGIQQNKNLERIILLFENTPIVKNDKFEAARFNISTTKYKIKKNRDHSLKMTILIYTILGLLLGIFYTLVIGTIQKR